MRHTAAPMADSTNVLLRSAGRLPIHTSVNAAAGKLPSHRRLTIGQSIIPLRTCRPVTAIFVIAANHRSVPTAVSGAVPKVSTRIGVISAPPPTPVIPTTKPVSAPAAICRLSTVGGSTLRQPREDFFGALVG